MVFVDMAQYVHLPIIGPVNPGNCIEVVCVLSNLALYLVEHVINPSVIN